MTLFYIYLKLFRSFTVIGRLMAPKDVHTLIPRTWECYLTKGILQM